MKITLLLFCIVLIAACTNSNHQVNNSSENTLDENNTKSLNVETEGNKSKQKVETSGNETDDVLIEQELSKILKQASYSFDYREERGDYEFSLIFTIFDAKTASIYELFKNYKFDDKLMLLKEIPKDTAYIKSAGPGEPSLEIIPKFNQVNEPIEIYAIFSYAGGETTLSFSQKGKNVEFEIFYSAD